MYTIFTLYKTYYKTTPECLAGTTVTLQPWEQKPWHPIHQLSTARSLKQYHERNKETGGTSRARQIGILYHFVPRMAAMENKSDSQGG